MHAVVRSYTGSAKLIDEMARRSDEVEQLIGSVGGFVAYHAVRSGDRLVTISICQDEEGTTETTRRAAEWVKTNVPPGAASAPQVTSGEAFINFTASKEAGATAGRA